MINNKKLNFVLNPSQKTCWYIFVAMGVIFFFSYAFGYNVLVPGSQHDDEFFFNIAREIASGRWLGSYYRLTLTKFQGFAIFLAFCMKTGIPYMVAITFYHLLASFYLLWKSEYLFDKYRVFWIFFGFLLIFNVFFMASNNIYRMQLAMITMVIFLGVLIGLFDKKAKNNPVWIKIIEAIFVAISFGFLFYNREEVIIYKIVLCFALLLFIISVLKMGNDKMNLMPLLYGLVGFLTFFLFISYQNYKHYGLFIIFEKSDTAYSDAFKTFNSIKDPNHKNPTMVSYDKFIYIANNVPEFAIMAQCTFQHPWSRNADEGQVSNSGIEWLWVDCVNAITQNRSAVATDRFNALIHKKLQNALESGILEKSDDIIITMSAYSIRYEHIPIFFKKLPMGYKRLFLETFSFMFNSSDSMVKVSNNPPSDWHPRPTRWTGNYATEFKSKLGVKSIFVGDEAGLNKAKKRVSYLFWIVLSKIYAVLAYPLIVLSVLFALVALIFSIVKRDFIYSFAILIASLIFIAYFLIFALISTSYYDLFYISYYAPNFILIIFTCVLSLYYLFKIFMERGRI